MRREKANARKRKFLGKMIKEEREMKRVKDRAYYQEIFTRKWRTLLR